MALVGGFPGLADMRRRTIPAPRNPMDKSTVVSIYPKPIHEIKPTIQPGVFKLSAGSIEKPAILVVGSSSWWREIDEEQPLLEIPNSSVQVAESIVRDWASGLLASNGTTIMPGIFWTPGEFTVNEIRQKHGNLLQQAIDKQNRWYEALVKMADTLWSRTNGNPLVISDDMRLAAKQLQVTNKDWMKDFTTMAMEQCFACGSLKNPDYPVCATCKAVDQNHPKAKDIKFAQ